MLADAAESAGQLQLQTEFALQYFSLAGQREYVNFPGLFCYSCSIGIEVVANYLRLTGCSVSLIHPSFDNVADILKRHRVALTAIEEEQITNLTFLSSRTQANALFIVQPNNPTGWELSREQFRDIARYCEANGTLLVLDFSFRFFSRGRYWDQYEILRDSGVSFIALEDTGKTWAAHDLKVCMLLSSPDLAEALRDINNDLLLNVSAFTLAILANMISLDAARGVTPSLTDAVKENRMALHEAVSDGTLTVASRGSTISVEWLRLPHHWDSVQFCWWLRRQGIHILPGSPFFWNDLSAGKNYVRVALAREPSFFTQAVNQLKPLVARFAGSL